MSQGFEIKSENGKKSASTVKKPTVVAEIAAIQQRSVCVISPNKTTREVQFYLTSLRA